jgi:hypothetical protein
VLAHDYFFSEEEKKKDAVCVCVCASSSTRITHGRRTTTVDPHQPPSVVTHVSSIKKEKYQFESKRNFQPEDYNHSKLKPSEE